MTYPNRRIRWTTLGLALAWCLSGAASSSGRARDYVVLAPEQVEARAGLARGAPAGPVCLGCGVEDVDYMDFDGGMHRLRRHPGRHVAVLVPTKRPGYALDAEELEELVDLLDLSYDSFAYLLSGEPAGDGLLEVALVRTPFGGRARLGNKGIEIGPTFDREIRRALEYGATYWLLLHEMGHNFDLYSSRTQYLPDHPHGWTFFTDLYMPVFSGAGDSEAYLRVDRAGYTHHPRSPREALRFALEAVWQRPWVEDPTADWERCVKGSGCLWWHNQLWAGFHLNLAARFGPERTRAFFDRLSRLLEGLVPANAESREEAWLEAWAASTRSDVTCYAEALRWHTSAGLRQRVRERYGRRAPLCKDSDGDGFRRIEGDCADRDRSVHPGVDELINGLDDDCDGHVDEEPIRYLKRRTQEIPFPAETRGRGRKGRKKHWTVRDATDVVWAQSCFVDGAQGWLLFENGRADGSGTRAAGACVFGKVEADRGAVRLRHDSHTRGEYDLVVAPGDPWPVPWAELAEPRQVGPDRVELAVDVDASLLAERPTHVRFWVSGTGWVATEPYRPHATAVWELPSSLEPGRYGVRAQLWRDGVPASQVSPMRVFRVD